MGYRFLMFTDSNLSLRVILSGADVLVSAPINRAWGETNTGYVLFHVVKAATSESFMNAGNISRISTPVVPVAQEFLFKLPEDFPLRKSGRF